MRNIDKIKAMRIDELADFLIKGCSFCVFYKDNDCWKQDCFNGHIQWLEQESEEVDG